MKKFAICAFVLVVAAMCVQAAQAQACITLTNFCDHIQYYAYSTKGIAGLQSVGQWDYVCLNQGTGTLISGNYSKLGPITMATQPTTADAPGGGGSPAGFQATWTFNQKKALFDLADTTDGVNIGFFQRAKGYTQTPGACNPLHANGGRSSTGQ